MNRLILDNYINPEKLILECSILIIEKVIYPGDALDDLILTVTISRNKRERIKEFPLDAYFIKRHGGYSEIDMTQDIYKASWIPVGRKSEVSIRIKSDKIIKAMLEYRILLLASIV